MANSNLKLKGTVKTDDDTLIALGLLQPSVTELDRVVTISPAVKTRSNGQVVRAYVSPRIVSNFAGGSIDFNTYAANVPTNNYLRAIITLNSNDVLEVVFGSPSAVLANATEPQTLEYPICMVVLHKTGSTLDVITNSSFEDRRPINQITGAPQFFASGDEIVTESYLFEVSDSFIGLPNNPDNSIDFTATGTSTSQFAASGMMTMKYANRTATVTSTTNVQLNSVASFTIQPNIHWVIIGGVARRITAVTNQLNVVVASPGFTNGAGQAATITEQVLTKDLYNSVGDSTQGTRVVDNVGGQTNTLVDSLILDYDDSVVAGDTDFDAGYKYTFTVTAANATSGDVYTVNNLNFTVVNTIVSGTTLVVTSNGAGTPPISGTLTKVSGAGQTTITYSAVVGSPNVIAIATTTTVDDTAARVTISRPVSKDGFVSEQIMPSPAASLKLCFLPNVTVGDGTVNLLGYQVFFIKDSYAFNGGIQNQAFGFTNNASGLNCLFSTLTTNQVNATLSKVPTTLSDATLELNATNQQRIAQKFVFTSTQQITSLRVNMRKVGSPTGTITCIVYNNSGGVPGTVAATSTTSLTPSTLTTSFAATSFAFTPINLGAGTYFISFETDATYRTGFAFGANRVEIQDLSATNSSFAAYTNQGAAYDGTNWASTFGRQFRAFSGGSSRMYAIETLTGNAYAWGLGGNGLLGNNSTANSSSPVSVFGGRSFSQIVGNDVFVVAIEAATGNAYAWGDNSAGYLGNNTILQSSTPVSVVGGRSYSAIFANGSLNSIFAIEGSTGNLYAWGGNTNGVLGDNTVASKSSPTSVVGGRSYRTLSIGSNHVVAIEGGTGNAYAWGLNTTGQLGDNTVQPRSSPTSVLGGRSYSQVQAAAGVTVAIQGNTGNAYAWGSNTVGQVGDNSILNRSSPTSVVGARSFKQIAGNNSSFVALEGSTGNAYSWGDNSGAVLGDNSIANRSSPTSVVGGRSYSNVAVYFNGSNFYALDGSNGAAYAWGNNAQGQIGDNSVATRSSPTSVLGGRSYSLIANPSAMTIQAAMALDSSGNAYVWGMGTSGQLGNGNVVNASSPVAVLGVGNAVVPYDILGNKNVTNSLITFNANFISYVPGVNNGTPYGDLIVLDSGVEIPRQTSTITDDTMPYYTEYTNNSILLWDDFSAAANKRQITVLRRSGTVDSSVGNGQFISDFKKQGSTVIYSASQVGCSNGDVVYFNGTAFVPANAGNANTDDAYGIIANVSGSTGDVILNGNLSKKFNIEVASQLVDQNTSGTVNNTFDGGTGAQVLIGQTFNSGLVSIIVSSVSLELWNDTAATGNIFVELWATTGGVPSGGAPLIASALINVNTLPVADPGSPTFTANFAGSVTLAANTTYAIVIRANSQLTNTIKWKQNNSGSYTNGQAALSTNGGASFAGAANDYVFTISGVPAAAVSLLPGNTYYLSQSANGKIVTPKPVSGIQKRIGFAVASDTLILDIASENVYTVADAIVGSTFQVSVGIATHTSLQAAHDAVASGSKIIVLSGSFAGGTTITKQLFIEGRGYASQLTGSVNLNAGSSDTYITGLRFANNVNVNSAVSALIITNCWLASGSNYVDGGVNANRNQIQLLQE